MGRRQLYHTPDEKRAANQAKSRRAYYKWVYSTSYIHTNETIILEIKTLYALKGIVLTVVSLNPYLFSLQDPVVVLAYLGESFWLNWFPLTYDYLQWSQQALARRDMPTLISVQFIRRWLSRSFCQQHSSNPFRYIWYHGNPKLHQLRNRSSQISAESREPSTRFFLSRTRVLTGSGP